MQIEIGATRQQSLYFSCLLYVSSFDIDSARSRSGLFFARKQGCLRLRLYLGRLVAETILRMIVHHTDRLHVRVDDGRADKLETALGQIL